jgi:AraC-like DNA-binding protein
MDLILDFLLITGILFTGLVLVILIRKQSQESPQKILIWIFLSILFVFLFYYSYLHRIRLLFYATFIFSDSTDVFIGPLILVYVKGIIGDLKNSVKDNMVHFIFPLVYLLAISIPAFLNMVFESFDTEYFEKLQPLLLFTILYSYAYCIVTYFKLINFQKLMKLNFSNLENRDLNWVKQLLIASMIILTIDISTSVYEAFVGDLGLEVGYISVIPIVFMVTYLGYYGILQSTVLLPKFLNDNIDQNRGNGNPLEKKYSYDSIELKNISELLTNLMTNEKLYLDEDITLSSLAEILKVPAKKLSSVLNQSMNTTFYDYINSLRIEEVKNRLASSDVEKYTLLAIAFDCGFKSKSSFNRIFKKVTLVSPSAYKKKLELNEK